jgi:squalene-hopene/tetraprenyl-beta-curcumene cyclase
MEHLPLESHGPNSTLQPKPVVSAKFQIMSPFASPSPRRSRPLQLLLALLAFSFPSFRFSSPAQAAQGTVPVADNGSLQHEITEALARGTRWLETQQNADGSWSDPRHPALTALPLQALQKSSTPNNGPRPDCLRRGLAFIRSQAKPDGGLYAETLSNYNTSLCLITLLQAADPADQSRIQAARQFLIRQQAQGLVRPELNGGIGYGPTGVSPKRQHPDLDNTLVALEALRACELASQNPKETPNTPPLPRLDWNAAIDFISRCQNLPETNPLPWASGADSERGGFLYYPGFSNAGEQELPSGSKALRSSGTMSYAGLLSFIYAELSPTDPRVQAALGWLASHYTLSENPGLGKQGLFYYYHLMAKALTAAQRPVITSAGHAHAWPRELALELLQRQESQGFWVNENGRWMEKDPVLVTSYSLLTLQLLRSLL